MSPPIHSAPLARAALLAVLCGAAFLEGMDIAMFNVALPSIRADLGLTTAQVQWIVSGYVVSYGALMLVGGRVADAYGHRRVFLVGLAAFTAFSLVGGLADDVWILIAMRVLTGACAAFLMPAGLAIINTTYPAGHVRDRAVLIYAGIGAAGFSIGLVAGGLLSLLGWRWVFLFPAGVGVLLFAGASALVPRDVTGRRGSRVDYPGAVLIAAAVAFAMLGIESLAHHAGPFPPVAWTVAAVTAFLLFIARLRRAAEPLLSLSVLSQSAAVPAVIGAASLAAGFAGFQLVFVFYLQESLGWSALHSALGMLVLAMDAILAPLLTPLLVRRFGVWPVATTGLGFALIAYTLFLPLDGTDHYLHFLPGLVSLGLAFTFAYGPLTIAATERAPREDQGVVSAVLYTCFQFGAALGIAGASVLYSIAAETLGDGLPALKVALIAPIVAAALGFACALAATMRRRSRPRPAESVAATSPLDRPA
ncbi:MFS transporter [Microbacterium lushaniae]|nr:MFS transporter [Microbacterium lushaniae]KAA9151378.1 MFS transporter [Microbacterium lushaniae]